VFLISALVSTLSIAIAPNARASGGDLDPSFGSTGWLDLAVFKYPEGTGLAVQDDGKILVSIGSLASDLFAVARFLPDGTPDPSFGGDGYVRTDLWQRSSAGDVLLQPDGAIVVAGISGRRMVVARYLTDGTLDPSFDGDGKASVLFGDRSSRVGDAALSPQGEIVLVGTAQRTWQHSQFAIARLTTSGAPDTSFSGDGKVLVGVGPCRCAGADGVAVASDGRVIAAGWAKSSSAIVVLDGDGDLAPAFGGDGIVRSTFSSNGGRAEATAVTLTSTEKIVIGGAVSGAWGPLGRLARLLPNGRLDTSFSGDGIRRFPSAIPEALAVQTDGKILVAGAQCCGGGSETFFSLWRFGPNGTPDRSFGSAGVVPGGGYELAINGWSAVALQADGRIVVTGGRESGGLVLARYLG
jgi:uncharacterized delta-60 repeat protein